MKHSLLLLLALSPCMSAQTQQVSESELSFRIQASRSHFPALDQGEDLRSRARETNADVFADKSMSLYSTSSICNGCPPPDPQRHPDVEQAARLSDLVAIGTVVRGISSLTTNGAFLFTAYEFRIQELWSAKADVPQAASPTIGEEITIIMPGGRVLSDGHVISAYVSGAKPMLPNHQYLVFLKHDTDSHSYYPVLSDGFDITGDTVVPVRSRGSIPNAHLLGTRALFLQAMRSSTLHSSAGER